MRSMCSRTLIGLIGVALLIGVAMLPNGQTALASGGQMNHVKTPRERLAERSFPNVTLTTHEGKKVRFYDDLIKDKIVLINFMYVKCEGICPGTTANLLKVQKMLGDRVGRDIFMYSITLKPEEDTPECAQPLREGVQNEARLVVLDRRPEGCRAAAAQAWVH